MQLELFPKPQICLAEVFEAYGSCRRNKRFTAAARIFEFDYEQKLIELWRQINNGTYKPGRTVAFIVDKPVKREIFAADFRDRIVHHLIINKINHLLEHQFIFDSYACRKGKGTHEGIRRLDRFIRSCSDNYSHDAWVLKLDIMGFFMSINRDLLFRRLSAYLRDTYDQEDRELLIALCRVVIENDPAKNCIIKGSRSDWKGLPPGKSLFHSRPGCGLPIGNFTSQVFANFYLTSLDHYIKHTLGIRWYGRYVDDMVFVHGDRRQLVSLISLVRTFLSGDLGLTLHPKKIYLQHSRHGVKFLGVIVKHRRIYIANNTKANFAAAIGKYNILADDHCPSKEERMLFQSSINSYMGILGHYNTYRLQKSMIKRVSFPH